jgi:molybdopterin/thiamine biosynthesis adenylyltransferase
MDTRFIRNPVTPEEQEALRGSKVFVAGCGGLGGYIIEYLARAGVGTIICADSGVFEESDLNRQLLSEPAALGRGKAECAQERISRIVPGTIVRAHNTHLDPITFPGLVRGCGLILDALDNHETRNAMFRAATHENIPVIYAAVMGWWAQAAFVPPGGRLPDALPPVGTPEKPVQVMSFVPGFAAGIQAAIAVNFLLGHPCNRDLHVWNLQTMAYQRLSV